LISIFFELELTDFSIVRHSSYMLWDKLKSTNRNSVSAGVRVVFQGKVQILLITSAVLSVLDGFL